VAIIARVKTVHAMRAGLLSDVGKREVGRREGWVIVPAVFLLSIPIAMVSTSAALYSWILIFILPRFRRVLAVGS
jgi:hypothetical protein